MLPAVSEEFDLACTFFLFFFFSLSLSIGTGSALAKIWGGVLRAWEVFLGKDVLKICCKVTGEHPCQSAISIKLLYNFIEITLWHVFLL